MAIFWANGLEWAVGSGIHIPPSKWGAEELRVSHMIQALGTHHSRFFGRFFLLKNLLLVRREYVVILQQGNFQPQLVDGFLYPNVMITRGRWVWSAALPRASGGTKNTAAQACRQTGKRALSPVIFWLVVYLPLWKIWLRQLGSLFPIYGQIKFMFQTTNQMGSWEIPLQCPSKIDRTNWTQTAHIAKHNEWSRRGLASANQTWQMENHTCRWLTW